MVAEWISGKEWAKTMREEIHESVEDLKRQQIVPGLGVILVGEDPASHSYVRGKEKACQQLGVYSETQRLSTDASQATILDHVHAYNQADYIHGILVQLPLPDSRMESTVIESVKPEKDVDGFHPVNLGRLLLEQSCFWPCTPHGILQLLRRSEVPIAGQHVVVVGRSQIVGRPLANMLALKDPEFGNATVTVCHSKTPDIGRFTRDADIVVVAVGRPGMLTADMIKPGAAVIDVGVNRVEDPTTKKGYRLVGDVDADSVSQKAGYLTPVPGGVGPMTITLLMANTVAAARQQNGLSR